MLRRILGLTATLMLVVGQVTVAQTMSRAELEVADAFVRAEVAFWEMEGLILRESMDAIVAESRQGDDEVQIRKLVRSRRSRDTLRKITDFLNQYIATKTLTLLDDIARANGITREEVWADYVTVEATIDFTLMAAAYKTVNGQNFGRFDRESQRLLENLVRGLRQAPTPSNDIKITYARGPEVNIAVFGANINEEVVSVEINRDEALLTWRSNYSFLRDVWEQKAPEEYRTEVWTYESRHWVDHYDEELMDFVNEFGRREWGLKLRELVDMEGYLKRDNPLATNRPEQRDMRFVYDPVVSSAGRYPDPRATDSRYNDPRNTDPRNTDPRYTDPRYTDPRTTPPRTGNYQDPRYTDPRSTDRFSDRDARELR